MEKNIIIITIALLILSCSSDVQKNENDTEEQLKRYTEDSKKNRETISDSDAITFKWKLKPNETIGYKTAMEQVESSDFGIDYRAFKNMSKEESKKVFDGLKEEFQKTSFITTMQWNDRGNIETKMFTEDFNDKKNKPFDPKNFDPQQIAEDTEKGIMLRGEISESGQIESFYLNSGQKNLIAMYFELPNRPVKIGDTWNLNVSYLMFNQAFVCKSANRTNNVELIDVLKDQNDTIVVIKYYISESASGHIKNPIANKKMETSLQMTFNGIAEFSVNKGRWIKYNGILETTQNDPMLSSSKTKLSLIPFDDLTKAMINIE